MSESASGEADDSTDSTDKDSSVACPTCEKDGFSSEHYMKVHHKAAHGESIAGVAVECDYCGDTFRKTPSAVNDHNFCSESCHGDWRSETITGEDHPRYVEDKPTVECAECGSEFEVIPAKEEKSRFCSMACKSEWQEKHYTGEGHPSWKGGLLELECEICGEEVERKPSHYEDQENVFCSYSCHREYQSRHQVGENHHNYNGGRAKEYGENWHRQRRKAIERDGGECQVCGVHRDDLNQDISVHHITPRREYIEDGEIDAERANALENLICVCEPCHGEVEKSGLPPDMC